MTYQGKTLGIASMTALAMLAGGAQAATLNGSFSVTAVNVTNLSSSQSEATRSNYDDAVSNSLGGGDSSSTSDTFTYDGNLSFETSNSNNSTTIENWLNTGSGTFTGLDTTLAGLTLSTPNINDSTATTTFFKFEKTISGPVTEFVVHHDDGMNIFDDGSLLGGDNGPTTKTTTAVSGFDGGKFELIYAATNGDPSVLEVSAVPLPASALLLLGGLGGLGGVSALRRRKRAA